MKNVVRVSTMVDFKELGDKKSLKLFKDMRAIAKILALQNNPKTP